MHRWLVSTAKGTAIVAGALGYIYLLGVAVVALNRGYVVPGLIISALLVLVTGVVVGRIVENEQ